MKKERKKIYQEDTFLEKQIEELEQRNEALIRADERIKMKIEAEKERKETVDCILKVLPIALILFNLFFTIFLAIAMKNMK